MVDETQETTTIRIKKSTHEKLKAKALYVETMDDLINRLMFEEQNKTTETPVDKKIKRLI